MAGQIQRPAPLITAQDRGLLQVPRPACQPDSCSSAACRTPETLLKLSPSRKQSLPAIRSQVELGSEGVPTPVNDYQPPRSSRPLPGHCRHRARLWGLVTGLLAALFWVTAPQAGYEQGIQALNRADYDAALRELRPLAEQGHAKAQWALGYMYSRGLGVPKDAARAERWRKRSVEGLLGKAPVPVPRQRSEVNRGGSGSGFLVDTRGRAVTSYHVVARCSRILLRNEKTLAQARVLAADPASDLALLAATDLLGGKPAVFRSPIGASLGERVMVAGFPLQGLLSTELQVASGMVSALAGPKGNTRLFQLSIPVQPGNSGGPVMDESGKVIGLVAGTLRGTGATRATGVAPENVGFAVRGAALQRFLDKAGSRYRSEPAQKPVDTRRIARAAREFTVLVECLR